MNSPPKNELFVARERFRHLLTVPTRESDWQMFFREHPYVLSRSLPLRLEPADILPLGRPGRAEPDFAFFPRDISPIPYYGVIEIKRPDSRIVSVTRSNVAILTRDAETAIEQAKLYAKAPSSFLPVELSDRPLFLGNQCYLFVVMGMSNEIASTLGKDLYRQTVEGRLPANLQLLPYDIILKRFEIGLPPQVFFLLPTSDILHT